MGDLGGDGGEVGRTEKRGNGEKQDKTRFQKRKRDLVTNWIQMIKEIGDLHFTFQKCKKLVRWAGKQWQRKS